MLDLRASELTLESLSCFFGGTQVAAARHFGISLSSMQRVCRRLGTRWPTTDALRGKRAVLSNVPEAECRPGEAFVRVFPKDSAVSVDVTVESLSCFFGGTQVAAARRLGVSQWTMKKICRRLGMRWPSSDRRHKRWSDLAREEAEAAEEAEEARLPAWREFGEEQPAEECVECTDELGLFSGGD